MTYKYALSFIAKTAVAALSVLIVFSLASCKKKEVKNQGEKLINVQVQAAQKKSVRPFIKSVGTLNPFESVIISAEVEGVLKYVNADEGTKISKGTTLASIDDTDYFFEVRRSEAALRQAEATLENTKLEFGRKYSLFKEELITRQQFDDVATRLSLAEAELDRAKATLSLARQKLAKTKIVSPINGVIKEKKVSAGDFVRNGSNLFVAIQPEPLKLNFSVPEKEVVRLKAGQDVAFGVDAVPEKEFHAKVKTVYPSSDERTRTLQVEALTSIGNNVLKPGMFASVLLYTSQPRDAVVVPITTLLYEGSSIRLFVIESGIAKERAVKVGQKYGEFMEIVEGVKEGESVVLAGQQGLFNNAKVNITGLEKGKGASNVAR
jgi:membrane fusion protein (multidrug efflux system)